jgi:hypothetical protein
MKTLFALGLSFFMTMSSASLFAQNTSETPENADGGRGTTGWTGGSREPTKSETTGTGQPQSEQAPAADQPDMASGADLKGPPIRFPADKTPE